MMNYESNIILLCWAGVSVVLTFTTFLVIMRVRKIKRTNYLWWSYVLPCVPVLWFFYFFILPFVLLLIAWLIGLPPL